MKGLVITVSAFVISMGSAPGQGGDASKRLKVLKDQFEELKGDLFSPQKKFDERYAGVLEELRKKAFAAANLALAVEVEKEAKEFARRKGEPKYSGEAALERLQRIYVDQKGRIEREREAAQAGLVNGYLKSLKELQGELTKTNKIDDAVTVQAEVRRVEGMMKAGGGKLPDEPSRLTGVDPMGLVDGTGKPARVFGDLEVMTYPWRFRNPRYIQMEKVGDELLTLAHLQGKMAGGGEVVTFGRKGESLLGFVAQSGQGSLAATAYALRDPRLKMETATIRFTNIKGGEPRKRLIHQSRGFCYLGGLWGAWGNNARCDVSIDPADGFYYLSCKFGHGSSGGKAISVEYPERAGPKFEVETASWKRGGPARDLIDAKDGIVLLSGLSGGFEGGGEIVRVLVNDKGKWQLRCQSAQPNTGARVLVMKWRW